MLSTAYRDGYQLAFRKIALSPPTQVDNFLAAVEQGKDVPPDATAMPPPGPPLEAQPTEASLGAEAAKAAALGIQDMLHFEKHMGSQGAGELFNSLDRQWKGQSGQALKGSLSFGPQGKSYTPYSSQLAQRPMPAAPMKPPPIPAAALRR